MLRAYLKQSNFVEYYYFGGYIGDGNLSLRVDYNGNLKDIDKPLIVSGILLALREVENKNFDIEDLTGDDINTDGEKIYNAIASNLKRSRVAPEVKRDKILSQFSIVKDTQILNETNS